jgi:NADH-quinone oxidoreductase subunit N
MSASDYFPLVPQFIVILGGMAVMLLEPFTPPERKSRLGQIAVLTTAAAAYSLRFQWSAHERSFLLGMLVADNFGVFFQWLFLVITGMAILVSMRFNERESINRGEYYALLLFSCTGMSLMAASADLILTFLGVEILSIATYILAGFKRNDPRSNESSLKYFLLGSFSTAFLLYGIALIYGSTGSTNYRAICELIGRHALSQTMSVIGLGLLLVGFGFKLALVPFHAWAPDVYEGAPTPITAFMTVGPKAAGFAALMRILAHALPALGPGYWTGILWALALLTMTLGNIVAILQSNLKRMLAYSAIAHAGYLCIGIVANSRAGFSAVLFYLVVYAVMNLGAFTILLSLSGRGDGSVHLQDYTGLGRRSPLLAAAFSVFLMSLAGIPLTGGFIGKFYLFSAAIQAGYLGLAIVGVLNSVISVFYYFRIMVVMYMKDPLIEEPPVEAIPFPVLAIILIATLASLWLGVDPAPILNLAGNSLLALQ